VEGMEHIRFRPEHYFQAGQERMRQARMLYDEGNSYALSMYIAGVAVESLLRTFKLLRDATFDEKHDLNRLFKASGILDVDTSALQSHGLSEAEAVSYEREIKAAIAEVYRLWRNELRFTSEDRMLAHLKACQLDRGAKRKGGALKANALALLKAAQLIHDRGVVQWASRRK
jgi:hypothetical protein